MKKVCLDAVTSQFWFAPAKPARSSRQNINYYGELYAKGVLESPRQSVAVLK